MFEKSRPGAASGGDVANGLTIRTYFDTDGRLSARRNRPLAHEFCQRVPRVAIIVEISLAQPRLQD